MKAKKSTKKAFRFPKSFTATVTQALFDASTKRRDAGKGWYLMSDCPLALAVAHALKIKRARTSASRVDCAVSSPSGTSRLYTHNGAAVVKAFDEKLAMKLPQTVTFTLTTKQENY